MSQIISIIMGGGRGTRLFPLTKSRCKPAVPLAGKYRLVDIPISNCLNSGCNKIYLLTQFNTASLHRHIRRSYRFDSFSEGFVDILAAEQTDTGGNWYQGTADAVRQNMSHFGSHSDDDYFLILSGDQLYNMDFRLLIEQHKATNADVTIASKPVPKSQASELGVMRVDDDLNIIEFIEKPKDPKVVDSLLVSDKVKANMKDPNGDYCMASMGIYVFSGKALAEAMGGKELDFGKEIIPNMLGKKKLCAYLFDGYWEDVGTVGMFFETNLALAGHDAPFNFYDEKNKVYTHSRFLPGTKISKSALDSSSIADGCKITNSSLTRCMIGVRSIIREGSSLENVVMMGADSYESDEEKALCKKQKIPSMGVGKNCKIKDAIIDKNARIGNNVELSPEGKPDLWEQDGVYVRDNVLIVSKSAIIADNTKI